MADIKYPKRPVTLIDQPGTLSTVSFGTSAEKRNLRYLPATDAADVGDVLSGSTVTTWDYTLRSPDGKNWRWIESANGVQGYVWADGATFTPVASPTLPEAPPPPEPMPTPTPTPIPAPPPPLETIRSWQLVINYEGTEAQIVAFQTLVSMGLAYAYWAAQVFDVQHLPTPIIVEMPKK